MASEKKKILVLEDEKPLARALELKAGRCGQKNQRQAWHKF